MTPGAICMVTLMIQPVSFYVRADPSPGLACIVDFITALVPMFLLWGVRMKKKTKVTLYIFLAMGVLTAGCSIGRAATLKQIYLTEDTTCKF